VRVSSNINQRTERNELLDATTRASIINYVMFVTMNEEDKKLEKPCKHKWCEVYQAYGEYKADPLVMIVSFYCEYCLAIRTKKVDMSWSKLWQEDVSD